MIKDMIEDMIKVLFISADSFMKGFMKQWIIMLFTKPKIMVAIMKVMEPTKIIKNNILEDSLILHIG